MDAPKTVSLIDVSTYLREVRSAPTTISNSRPKGLTPTTCATIVLAMKLARNLLATGEVAAR